MAPVEYRVGDVVEVQLSFVIVPLREGRWKMLLVLRAITLIDAVSTKVRVDLVLGRSSS